jgi:hypothetical protein
LTRIILPLLLVGWLVLGIGLLADSRRGSPEPTVRRYLADLQAHRLEAALAALAPAAAERWRGFVEFQQFNRYQVVSIAVRSPSPLESIATGRAWQATRLTLVVDVEEPSGLRWRGSTLVPVARRPDQSWLLERPPFAED